MTSEGIITRTVHIRGMFCTHCETRIRRALLPLSGIRDVQVSFEKESAEITYSPGEISIEQIRKCIEEAGYEMEDDTGSSLQSISIIVILAGLWIIAVHLGWDRYFNYFPRIENSFSLGVLFLTGLMTSIHCVSMCGGINLTQSVISSETQAKIIKTNSLYQLGRVISYTVTGAVVGGIGQVISLNGMLKGLTAVLAGCAMLFMGLKMLGVFRGLRGFRFAFLEKFHPVISVRFRANSSLVIGLLNGLMPCGPLQSMQLYALSTRSALKGALAMLFFSLGTIPLMFGFGLISGKLNRKYARVMLSVSAFLITILGLNMISNGLSLSGVSFIRKNADDKAMSMLLDDIQTLRTEVDYGSYPAVQVKAGIPVKWTIVVPEGKLNGCNGEIIIPAFDIDIVLQEGDNLLEFTAKEAGIFPYSCWMGMIKSTIEVTE